MRMKLHVIVAATILLPGMHNHYDNCNHSGLRYILEKNRDMCYSFVTAGAQLAKAILVWLRVLVVSLMCNAFIDK